MITTAFKKKLVCFWKCKEDMIYSTLTCVILISTDVPIVNMEGLVTVTSVLVYNYASKLLPFILAMFL